MDRAGDTERMTADTLAIALETLRIHNAEARESRQWQYSPDHVVPMAGPFGFVFYGWVYNGDLYLTRLVLEFITKLAFGLLVIWFFRRTRGSVTGWLWLLANSPWSWTLR